MAIELRGKPVADAINERVLAKAEALKAEGVNPTLAIVRLGENPDDLSYEKGAIKRCEGVGVTVKTFQFDRDISHTEFMEKWRKICNDESIHGILLFRPLPPQIIEAQVKGAFPIEKDIDCLLDYNLGRIFVDDKTVAPPCTAQAVMELLDFYDIPVAGKNIVVVGRSLVVGKPLAMLLMQRNATVTICHSRTRDLKEACKNADIVFKLRHMLAVISKRDRRIRRLSNSNAGEVFHASWPAARHNLYAVDRAKTLRNRLRFIVNQIITSPSKRFSPRDARR